MGDRKLLPDFLSDDEMRGIKPQKSTESDFLSDDEMMSETQPRSESESSMSFMSDEDMMGVDQAQEEYNEVDKGNFTLGMGEEGVGDITAPSEVGLKDIALDAMIPGRVGTRLEEKVQYGKDLAREFFDFDTDRLTRTGMGKVMENPVVRTAKSGAWGTAASLAKIPAFAAETLDVVGEHVFTPPKTAGKWTKENAPAFYKQLNQGYEYFKKTDIPDDAYNTFLVKHFDEAAQAHDYIGETYGDKGVGQIYKEQGAAEAAKFMGLLMVKNAPQLLAVVASGLTGTSGIVLPMFYGMTGAEERSQQIDEGKRDNTGLLVAHMKGAMEVAGEKFGTLGYVDRYIDDLVKVMGKGAAKYVLMDGAKFVAASMLGEGTEEGVTELGGMLVDYFIGKDPGAFYNAKERVFTAVAVGAGGGLGVGAPMAIHTSGASKRAVRNRERAKAESDELKQFLTDAEMEGREGEVTTEEALERVATLAEKLGVKLGDIKIKTSDEYKEIDADTTEGKSFLREAGYTDQEVQDAIERGEKFIIDGEHTISSEAGRPKRSDITLYRGYTAATVFHEFAHSVEEQGGLAGWVGSKEEHARYIEYLLVQGEEGKLSEFTEEGAKVTEEIVPTKDIDPDTVLTSRKIAPAVEPTKSQVKEYLPEIRTGIADGEPGYKHKTPDSEWLFIPSTFPEWFKGKGYTKKFALNVLDKVDAGKELTPKQQEFMNDVNAEISDNVQRDVDFESETQRSVKTLTAQEAKSQGMGFDEWSEGRTKAFHGTSADFEEFKISGKGSPYKREAVGPHFGTREQADFVTSTKGDKGKTKEFILDIKNPVRLEDRNSWSHSGVNSQLYEKGIITKEEYEANVYGAEDYDIRETLKAKGYDGIVYNNTAEGPGDSYIAFSNDQIKTETQLRNEWEEAGTQKSVRRAKTTETGELEVIPEEGEYRELEDGTEVIQLDRPLRDYTHALEQARKIRKAKSMTKQEVKKVQKQFEDILKDSELVEDKGKFMTAMRNIQTQQQLESALPHIKERIERLENSRKARNVRELIDLELKRTKNLKGSIKSKGRYNYEDNKIFEMMRTFNRLTNEKAQVLLDELPTAENETMSMIERFLSMKANGAAASLEITERVFADIKKAKKAAESSKDEADMERKLNKAEKRDELVNAVKTKKGTKRDFRNRVMDYYMRGFGGIHSFINGMANKKLADELDPELNESRMQTAISSKMRQIAEGIARIYGIKPGEVTSMLADLSREKFDITDETGFKAEITRMELLDIYNTIKNEKKKEQYYKQFGREQIDGLMQEVTKDYRLVELADYMQEIVQDYRKIFNDRNIELFNVDMGFVENYWPASSEQMVDVRDDIKMQGNTASALKNRANWAIPIPKNAFNKMMNHIAQGEHITHMTKSYENLKRLFSDRLVKNMIKNTFGEEAWNALDRQIERISLGKQAEALDIHSGFMGKVLGNWVTAKIALSPSVFAKQLISVGNYMEVMPVAEWTKHFMSGIAHPKQTLDYMWKIAPFLEARYGKGYSEAITNALDSAKEASKAQENWAMALSSLVRMGDIGAIIYGGYPVIKSEMAKHGDIQRALDVFETATLKAQQSGMVSGRSEFQNSSSPLTRFFLAFKNTPTQYLRKQVDAVVSYANGDISKAQLTKTFAIYGVIQPTMYAFAGMAMRSLLYGGDTDDKFKEWLEALAFAPFNAIPAMDDIIGAVIKKLLGKKVYRVFSLPLLDDIESALRGVFKKKVTLADWLESFGAFAEAGTGAPIKTFTRIAQRGVRRRKGIEAKAKAKRKAEKSASSLSSWT